MHFIRNDVGYGCQSKGLALSKKRVLVVDDEAFNFDMLEIGLGDTLDLSYAANGKDALGISVQSQPDIILLDICMPGLDGYDTCRLLKNTPETSNIPVILLSGLENDDEVQEGFESGCDAYVTKPFEMSELMSKIQSLSAIKE